MSRYQMMNDEQIRLQQDMKNYPQLYLRTSHDQNENEEINLDTQKKLLEVNQNKMERIDKQSCYLDNSKQQLMFQKVNKNKQIPIQIQKFKFQQQTQKQRKKTKRWNMEQDKLYIKFLQQNAHLFRYKSVRRVRQIFILLSQKMGKKKTPAQCKTHHQKMKNATERGTVKEIISYVKSRSSVKINYKNYYQPTNQDSQLEQAKNNNFKEQIIKINLSQIQEW